MKAISIRQPWAHAIVHLGKDIENRDWSTRYRGPVLIHASKGMTRDEFESASALITQMLPGLSGLKPDLRFGGIVGQAEIVDCVDRHDSPWFFGRYGFVLRNVQSLPFRPCRGALGFFDPVYSPAVHGDLLSMQG